MFAHSPTQAAFYRSQYLLVSLSGDPRGFVDELLARRGVKRRIALTVPTFMGPCLPFKLRSDRNAAASPRRKTHR
jgi:hypothetical protein